MKFKQEEKKQLFYPLVSVVVITYNSSKYILETLESIKNQTYKNIELVISDDCSTDNTIKICREWIEENKNSFVRIELIVVEKNTGIPSNFNRGLYAAQGEWLKFIAGDDYLIDSCIYNFIEYVMKSKVEINVIVSNMAVYDQEFNDDKILYTTDKYKEIFNNINITPADQLSLLVRGLGPSAPASFFRKNLLVSLGGFDEELPYEDGPIWVKITSNNYKINFLNLVTVKYRYYDSISNSIGNATIFNKLYKSDYYVYKKVYKPFLTKIEFYSIRCEYIIKDIFAKLCWQEKTRIRYYMYTFATFPFKIIQKIIRKWIVLRISHKLSNEVK